MVWQADLSTIGATKPPHGNVDRVDWNCESHCHNILDLGDVLRRHSHVEPVLNRCDNGSLSLKTRFALFNYSRIMKTNLHVEVVLSPHLEPSLDNLVRRCHGSVNVPILPGGWEHGSDVEGVLHPLLDVDHHRTQALVFDLHLTCCSESNLPVDIDAYKGSLEKKEQCFGERP